MTTAQHNKATQPIFDAKGRYASALFDLALEDSALAERQEEVAQLLALIEESEVLRDILTDQSLAGAAKEGAVKKLAQEVGFSNSLRSFMCLVIQKGRAAELGDILATFQRIADGHNNIVHIGIASTQVLNPSQQERLAQLCLKNFGEGCKIEFTIDEALIGGVKLNLPNQVIDASVAAKFSHLEDNFRNHFQTI